MHLSKVHAHCPNMLIRVLSQFFSRGRGPSRIDPRLKDWLQQGRAQQQAGATGRAEELFRRALEVSPDSGDAHFLLGSLLGQSGALNEAATHLERAITLRPDFADAHAALGNVRLSQDDRKAALASYQEAVRLDGRNAAVHSNLGLLHQSSGRHVDALRQFKLAHAIAPELPGLLRSVTTAHIELTEHHAALEFLDPILEAHPGHLEALKCKGYVRQKMHQPQRALEYYERVLELGDDDAELFNNLGIVLQDLGRLERAIEYYNAALSRKPDFSLARWHRSLAYLLQHDFAPGWPDYELRSLSLDYPHREKSVARWDGGSLDGRAILAYAEQGLGDEIMFASCLPELIAMSGRCVIECSPKLYPLFKRSFPSATVHAKPPDASVRLPPAMDVDVEIGIGSLPLHLRRTLNDFPQHAGYLRADPERVSVWRSRLAALGPGLKVGISWQGGTYKTRRDVRSLPLAAWLPILQVPEVSFVSLQYTDCSEELAQFAAQTGINIHDWEEVRADYEHTVALVSSLDLVISVCTAVVHLSGALGRAVWVLAPYSPEWRYGISADKMPWYPSSRVFRQPRYGEWMPVIDRAAHELSVLSRSGHPAGDGH